MTLPLVPLGAGDWHLQGACPPTFDRKHPEEDNRHKCHTDASDYTSGTGTGPADRSQSP